MRSAIFKLEGGRSSFTRSTDPRLEGYATAPDQSSYTVARIVVATSHGRTDRAARIISGKPRVGAVITTDVNTDGERTNPLPLDKLSVLFDELRDLTMRFVTRETSVSALIAPPKRVEQATFFKRRTPSTSLRSAKIQTQHRTLWGSSAIWTSSSDQSMSPTQVSLSEAGWTTLGSSAAIVDTCDPAARHQRP